MSINHDPLQLFLVVTSGLCWTIVYLDSIRIGFRDFTYAIPLWALALNIAWELQQAVLEYQQSGIVLQVVISTVWFLLDVIILVTFFRFGNKFFPKNLHLQWFLPWSILVLVTSFVLEYVFLKEFGLFTGRKYAAFLQNLLMSILFIGMLVRRGTSEGQRLTIALNKWLGTLTPTIYFGVMGGDERSGPNTLILVAGCLCTFFDLIYISMLIKVKALENRREQTDIIM